MHVLSPVADRERAQREFATLAKGTLDEHWAVAAVATDRRALLIERAEVAAGDLVEWGVARAARVTSSWARVLKNASVMEGSFFLSVSLAKCEGERKGISEIKPFGIERAELPKAEKIDV